MDKIVAVLFILLFCSCSDHKHEYHDYGGYIVNSEIKNEVEKHVQNEDGVTEWKLFENGELHPDDSNSKAKIPITSIGNINGDTIHIVCSYGLLMMSCLEFDIDLFKDHSSVSHYVASDVNIFKLNKEDTALYSVMEVACNSVKIILVSKPQYKEGETVEGKIEYTTADYYQDANGAVNKYSEQVAAYFKTGPLKKLR